MPALAKPQPSPVAVIAGPSGVGKSEAALALARRLPIEIIAADSMQVYRGLDIGTAKPSAEARQATPHHLIDVASPEEHFDLAGFLDAAGQAIDAIRGRGRIPLLVGGTGLYLKGLSDGIFSEPSRDPSLRERLERRAHGEGLAELHAELSRIDPEAAGRISQNDPIRIIRALEVFQVTGRTISQWHADPAAPKTPARPLRMVVLCRRRESLYARIEQRVQAMLGAGWVEEVRALLASGLDPGLHCLKALGYGTIVRALSGAEDPASLAESIALQTRKFAKRQLTWFRGMGGAAWLDIGRQDPPSALDSIQRLLFPDGAQAA